MHQFQDVAQVIHDKVSDVDSSQQSPLCSVSSVLDSSTVRRVASIPSVLARGPPRGVRTEPEVRYVPTDWEATRRKFHRLEGNAAKNQEGTANFKAKVVPAVQKLHGARSSFLFANATTGKAIAGSTWDTKEDLDKSEAQIGGLRQEAVKLVEGKAPKTEIFEIMFTEILAPTKTGG